MTSLAGAAARRLERIREWRVLAVIVLVAWLAVLALGLTVRHAGWTWYQGGDQLWFYTDGWLLAHGHLGYAGVGYLWPTLLAPIALVAGPNVQNAYPAVILVDVLVLLPVALVALYALGKRIAGRLFGYWCCAVFLAAPFVGILYVNTGYHQRYVEQFLPQALGLTALSDFPALVAVLISAYFCVRIVLDEYPRTAQALASGLAAGAAVGIKPSAALFLGGPALALFDARRLRPALLFAAGIVPAAVTMGFWKLRSGHHVPPLAQPGALHLAAALSLPLALNFHRLINLDWGHFGGELANLRRYFAVGRLGEWAPIAGVIGLGRRSPGAAVLVGGWLGTFVVIKGTWDSASLETGSLLRIMIPAFPAFVLLVASLPFLWPGLPQRLQAQPRQEPEGRIGRRALHALIAGVLLTAVFPFVAIAATAPEHGPNPHAVAIAYTDGPTATDVDIGLAARRAGRKVVLTWRPQHTAGGPLFYHVFRGPAGAPDYLCDASTHVQRCYLKLDDLGPTRAPRYVDTPGPGTWVYRVGVAANWANDTAFGDVYVLSSRVVVAG